jgi:hypothetical protein
MGREGSNFKTKQKIQKGSPKKAMEGRFDGVSLFS